MSKKNNITIKILFCFFALSVLSFSFAYADSKMPDSGAEKETLSGNVFKIISGLWEWVGDSFSENAFFGILAFFVSVIGTFFLILGAFLVMIFEFFIWLYSLVF